MPEIDYQSYVSDGAQMRAAKEMPGQGALEVFARQAAYTGVQSPIEAVAQLPDLVLGTNLQEKVHFMDPAQPAPFMSLNWHAGQLGNVAGMLPWMIGLQKGTAAIAGTTAEGSLANKIMTNALGQSAIVGGVYGGLLVPTRGEGVDFVANRFRNAGVTAATMATMTGTGMLIGDRFGSGRMASALKGGASGVAAGVVNRELYSLSMGEGLVVDQQLAEAVYTFGLLGAANGALFPEVSTKKSEKSNLPELRGQRIDDAAEIQSIYEQHAAAQGGSHKFVKPDVKPGEKGYAEYKAWEVTSDFLAKNPNFKVSTNESPIKPDGSGGQAPRAGDVVIVKLDSAGAADGAPWTPGAQAIATRYRPVEGKPGIYSPRAVPTEMVTLSGPLEIKTSWGSAKGDTGAQLVKYGPGDFNIVSRPDLARLYANGVDVRSHQALMAIQAEQAQMAAPQPKKSD